MTHFAEGIEDEARLDRSRPKNVATTYATETTTTSEARGALVMLEKPPLAQTRTDECHAE